jgi:Lon protease-like protein
MSEALERARAAVRRLKVFPLPQVVLLPGTAVPLHIFEPRYRELVKDAVATDGVFALAQVIPGHEVLLAGAPALEPMLCVGVIAVHEPLDDGRSNLVLAGVARARVLRELPRTHLYREVEAELLEDGPVEPALEQALRQAVVELVARVPVQVGQRLGEVTARVAGGALADVVASAFMQDVPRRFEVLSETDVNQRVRMVTEELLLLVGQLKPRKPELYMN